MFLKIQNHLLILMTMNSRGVEDVSENPKLFINFVRHPQDERWCTWPPARNRWTAATRTTPRSVPALVINNLSKILNNQKKGLNTNLRNIILNLQNPYGTHR